MRSVLNTSMLKSAADAGLGTQFSLEEGLTETIELVSILSRRADRVLTSILCVFVSASLRLDSLGFV